MHTKSLLFLTASAISCSSLAVTDVERTTLIRLSSELETISLIVDEAEQGVNPDDRKKINYEKLRADLEKVQEGIRDAINSQRREPRSLPPVEGEY